ncbi:MAG: RNA polymerase sigma-70 factor [Bacteroidota bacterium]|nr:RNA polymerase sigma-70 factor [Bacteroidota bacterium]
MFAASLDNENELLLLVSKGDETAFRQLFDHYWDKIYSVALTLTKSSALSEEIAQDVFLKIWLKREQLSSVEKFDGYLFTVARNHIYNELRKKTMEQPFVEQLEQHFLESSALPEQMMLLKETKQLIDKAVELLPDQQRAVYEMSRNEGLDYTAIAGQLGISRSTVKNHMTRALQFLRQYLSEHRSEIVVAATIMKLLS